MCEDDDETEFDFYAGITLRWAPRCYGIVSETKECLIYSVWFTYSCMHLGDINYFLYFVVYKYVMAIMKFTKILSIL